jgi:hypothetical protein
MFTVPCRFRTPSSMRFCVCPRPIFPVHPPPIPIDPQGHDGVHNNASHLPDPVAPAGTAPLPHELGHPAQGLIALCDNRGQVPIQRD